MWAAIRQWAPLKRMQWIIAQVPSAEWDAEYEMIRYIDKSIPSAATFICYAVKDSSNILVYSTDIIKKDKQTGLLYVLSLFNLFMELKYTWCFNRLVGQKIENKESVKESISSATDKKAREDDELQGEEWSDEEAEDEEAGEDDKL